MESITDQINYLKNVAKERSLQIVDVLSEAKSAKKPGRPVFDNLLERIRAGEADGILCWKLNRLSRNPIDGGMISWMLQENVLEVITTVERSYFTSDSVIMMALEFSVATQYVKDLSKDVKRGLVAKANRGWFHSVPPIGYLSNARQKDECEIINDPKRFNYVKQIFKLVLDGTHNPIQAHNEIIDMYDLRTPRGTRLSKSALYAMLKNPFYAGIFEYPKNSGNWINGKHNSMLSMMEFTRLQQMINPKLKPNITSRSYSFKYRGHMRCGECGAKITAEHKTKKQVNGNIHRYVYYHCTRKKKIYCSQRSSVSEKELENQVIEIFREIHVNINFHKWARQAIQSTKKVTSEILKKSRLEIEKEIEIVSSKIDTLLELRMNNVIDDETFKKKNATLSKSKIFLQKELVSNRERVSSRTVAIEEYLDFASQSLDEFINGCDMKKSKLFLILGSNLLLKDKKLSVDLPETLLVFKKYNNLYKSSKEGFEPLDGSAVNESESFYTPSRLMWALQDELRTSTLW